MLFWGLSLAFGIVFQSMVPFSRQSLLILFGALLIIMVFFSTKKSSSLALKVPFARFFALLISLFLIGMLLYSGPNDALNPYPKLEALDGDEIVVSGRLKSQGKTSSGKNRYYMEVDSLSIDSTSISVPHLNILLTSSRKFQQYEYLKARVTWRKMESTSTQGVFNYAEFLSKKGIWYSAQFDSVISIYPIHVSGIRALEKWMNFGLDRLFADKNRGLASALLLGDKSGLDKVEKQAFSLSGLSHILAVSGLHVGFVVAPFFVLLVGWRNSISKMIALTVFFFSVLFGYVLLTGASPSVTRAAIMAGLLFFARTRFLPYQGLNILGATAFLILIFSPEQLFDIGFQLSFSAVAVIMIFGGALNRWFVDHVEQNWIRWIGLTFVMSFIIQLVLAPILAMYFETLSFAGSISNLIAMIPAALLVQAALPTLLIFPFFPALESVLSPVFNFLASSIHWAAELGESLRLVQFTSPHVTPVFLIFWVLGLILIINRKNQSVRIAVLYLALIPLVVLVSTEIRQSQTSPKFQITAFDIGQGDAFLLETVMGKKYLIDTGPGFAHFSEAKNVIIPFLKHKGIKRLDGIFISHWHADHSGGLRHISEAISVDSLFGPPSKRAPSFDSFRALREGEIKYLDAQTPMAILNPSVFDHPHDENDNSNVFLLQFGNNTFLFTGDAEKSVESELVRDYADILDVDFLKVGHHGSRTSSSSEFIAHAKPEIAVVSNQWRSRFKHPHPESIDVLNDYSKLYFTALLGTTIFSSDGTQIWVSSSK